MQSTDRCVTRRSAESGVYSRYIKRPMDFVLSFFALLVLSPVFGIVAILVRLKLGSPVIFKQERPGFHEKIFTLYKFRTMTDQRDDAGNLLPDEKRLTKFGKFLRSTSLDELPELWNILKGDMAVVGPRPLLVEYLPLYSTEQRHRHDVRPGLTGLAQVTGRNAIAWEDKFTMDILYTGKIRFLEDCRIILKTLVCVFKRSGIAGNASDTTESFAGTGHTGGETVSSDKTISV